MQVPRVRAQGQGRVQGVTREESPLAGICCTTHVHTLFSNRQMVQGHFSSL